VDLVKLRGYEDYAALILLVSYLSGKEPKEGLRLSVTMYDLEMKGSIILSIT